MLDPAFFDGLNEWSTLGDALATSTWSESVSPDERYDVTITWKYRGHEMGKAELTVEPILDTDKYRLFWKGLTLDPEWQNQGVYTNLVDRFATSMPRFGVVEVIATPWDKEAERRLASRGFKWRGNVFVLDFGQVIAERHTEPS